MWKLTQKKQNAPLMALKYVTFDIQIGHIL